jgi:hypothetical protein
MPPFDGPVHSTFTSREWGFMQKIITLIILTITIMQLPSFAHELMPGQQGAAYQLEMTIGSNAVFFIGLRKDDLNLTPINKTYMTSMLPTIEQVIDYCNNTGLPDDYSFEIRNSKGRAEVLTFKQVKQALVKWKKFIRGIEAGTSKLFPSNDNLSKALMNSSSEQEVPASDINQQGLSNAQLEAIGFMKSKLENRIAYVIKMKSMDHCAVSFVSDIQYLKEPLDECMRVKVPDTYEFDMGNGERMTMKRLKLDIPEWIEMAKTYPDLIATIRELNDAYAQACYRTNEVINGNESIKSSAKLLVIDPIEVALKKAKEKMLPENAIIGYGTTEVPYSTIADLRKRWPGWRKYFEAAAAQLYKERQAEIEPYLKLLSGDKLKLFNEYFGTPQSGLMCFGENGKVLTTPKEYANSKIWASVSSPRGFLQPHWEVLIFYFDGMSLINKTTTQGIGLQPPAGVFK